MRVRNSVLAGSAAALFPLWRWNPVDLKLLDEHPAPPVLWWLATCLLLATAVMLLVKPGRRLSALAPVAAGTAVVLVVGGAAVALMTPRTYGDPVARATNARYEVLVHEWHAVLGEPGWDVTIRRNDRFSFTDAEAGCLYSGSTTFEHVESMIPGAATLLTSDGPLTITFSPDTMKIITPIPQDLCPGYA